MKPKQKEDPDMNINQTNKKKPAWVYPLLNNLILLTLTIFAMRGSGGALNTASVFILVHFIFNGLALVLCVTTEAKGMEDYRPGLPWPLGWIFCYTIVGLLAWQGQSLFAVIQFLSVAINALIALMMEDARQKKAKEQKGTLSNEKLSEFIQSMRDYKWLASARDTVAIVPKDQLDGAWDWAATYLVELARRINEEMEETKCK